MADLPSTMPPLPPATRYVVVANELVEQLSAEWCEPVRIKIVEDDGQILKLVFRRDTALHG